VERRAGCNFLSGGLDGVRKDVYVLSNSKIIIIIIIEVKVSTSRKKKEADPSSR